ncbi:ATP-binding protein [Streptomyces johnsoniae]|uniref:ATP-binding protein n=1 Tax=Streptomyces johnsoniae TaxID=3075532 RepID=A0ABU2RZN6_9ACTN|nr:ATP-binding protein [Streptomyces sp. DSM 41886]MDT0442224.1 ATP-binding protein [Streptomyces sp. DSM 41886]
MVTKAERQPRRQCAGRRRPARPWRSAVEWRDVPQTSGHARDLTRAYLAGPAVDARAVDLDAVLLVVSELVTNAIRHAGGVTGFCLEAGPRGVAVFVSDASSLRPVSGEHVPGRAGGFGWRLVRQLGSAVTVSVGPGAGKTVRVHVPVPDHARAV